MILHEKNKLRLHLKEKRHLFIKRLSTETLKKYSSSYVDFFLDALHPIPPLVIGGYWPIQDEADCKSLLHGLFKRGFICALPCIQALQKPLIFQKWSPEAPLKFCPFFSPSLGLMEPLNTSPCLIPHIILVPTLGFDKEGYRLGYGGGFYDRTLKFLRTHSKIPPISVGVSFSCQKIDSLPHDPHDEKLDWILTEEGMHKISAN